MRTERLGRGWSIKTSRSLSAVFLAATVLAGLTIGVAPVATAEDGFVPGDVPLSRYAEPGPYETAQTTATHNCDSSPYGSTINNTWRFWGNQSELQCTNIFPSGTDSPIGVTFYYPKDIANMDRLPVLVYSPGTGQEPGYYDWSARFWASYGYVIAIPYDLLNSTPEMGLGGVQALSNANKNPDSPMFGKVDLSRVIFAGHSGGGGATQLNASLPPDTWHLIDPDVRVIGAVPTEPSAVALGILLTVPTLYLTGCSDALVWHWYYPMWTQYHTAITVPAYLACVRGGTHITPMDDPAHNPFAPLTLAWMQYLAKGDKDAARYFVGPNWTLPGDPGVEYVMRNALADRLPE